MKTKPNTTIEILEARIAPAFTAVNSGIFSATFTGDAASDTLTIVFDGGSSNFTHNRFAAGDAGFVDAFDFNSTAAGSQRVTLGGGSINVNGGAGTDNFSLTSPGDISLGSIVIGGTATLAATGGQISDSNGVVVNVTAGRVVFTALGSIGTSVNPIETQVGSLEADAQGEVFITNGVTSAIALTIGGISSTNGVQTTSGDISIINNGSITISTSAEIVKGPGNVTVQANGATANVLLGGGNTGVNGAIVSTGGLVTVGAGQDIFVGNNAGAGTAGDINSAAGITLSVGRNLVVNEGSAVTSGQGGNPGDLTATAVGNVSLLATHTAGGKISAAGSGNVSVIAGAAGIFTHNSGTGGTVSSATGDVTIAADDMAISRTISAAGNVVTLQNSSSELTINVGTNVAGSLGLTDAEVDFVTAGVLRIGSATAGDLTVSAAINALNTSTLSLISSSNVSAGAAGTITETSLRVTADLSVLLDVSAHNVGTFAAAAGGSVRFTNGANPLIIGTADGVSGLSPGTFIILVADSLAVQQAMNAGSANVNIVPFTAGRAINLGTATGALDLTDGELDFITAGVLRIGNSGSGAINVSSALTPANAGALSFSTGAAISGAGSISTAKLKLIAITSVALNGVNDVDTLAVNFGSGFSFADADGFTIGPVDGELGFRSTGTDLAAISAGANTVAFASSATFTVDINGTTPGTQLDQLAITGVVDLGGATLAATTTFTPRTGDEFVIISNDLADAVSGPFNGLAEGASLTISGEVFTITYHGGDGNDVALLGPKPLAVTLSLDKKSATFTDVDGDLVTVKASKGLFDGSEFTGLETGANGAGQLQTLKLGADFTGAAITFTAKATAQGGNGFVNLGLLDATGVDLGAVKIAGDLGRIAAGTPGGDLKVPGVKSLAVQSIGLLGTSTQAAGGNLDSKIEGALPKLSVKGDLRDVTLLVGGAADGILGSATIGGSIVSTQTGGSLIFGDAAIGTLKIGGDVRTNSTVLPSTIATNGTIGAITIGGSIIADSAAFPVQIRAFGKVTAPAAGIDLAIKSVTIRGSVENAVINVGIPTVGPSNADASIGSITVGGDWLASVAVAGATSADGRFGNGDDLKIGGGARDNPDISSTIGSFTVKGQALGTATPTSDMFGVVAERIGKAKVGGRTFAFVADKGATLNREAFFAAPTGPGSGAENPAFDFTIRELGSVTPVIVAGGDNLDISSDGKTATYTDVDGDSVTVKRSAGAFAANGSDFTFAAAGIGGQLQRLVITAAPGDVPVGLSITARPGSDGGNGFLNVGFIEATGHDLGDVFVDGDLGQLKSGDSDDAHPALKSLTAHSLGAFGTSTQAAGGLLIVRTEGVLGKLTIRADVRFASVITPATIGSATIGGAFFGEFFVGGSLIADRGMGTVKIGGSVLGGSLSAGFGAIGAVSIGGDLSAAASTFAGIFANGQTTQPPRGLDVALKSLTVKGTVEGVRIEVGTNPTDANADASIGKISVGRGWLASSVVAGAGAGGDFVFGTSDDAKIIGSSSTRDVVGRFSTIASIVIKGQALGSAAGGDTFGIVAEQIGKAQIGAVKFKFILGPDTATTAPDVFTIGPTGPGATGLLSDFFLREIVL